MDGKKHNRELSKTTRTSKDLEKPDSGTPNDIRPTKSKMLEGWLRWISG
jgi:hypothetical protein